MAVKSSPAGTPTIRAPGPACGTRPWAAAALSHPNVAQVYNYGEADVPGARMPYVVMELVRGGTLQDRLTGGPVPPRYAMRVCAALRQPLLAEAIGQVRRLQVQPPAVSSTTADGCT